MPPAGKVRLRSVDERDVDFLKAMLLETINLERRLTTAHSRERALRSRSCQRLDHAADPKSIDSVRLVPAAPYEQTDYVFLAPKLPTSAFAV